LQQSAKLSVDGVTAALEIRQRSSYVPSSPIWRPIPAFSGRCAPESGALARLELPAWMK
jgi:hypothetical protein